MHTPGPWTADRMLLPAHVQDRRSGFVVNGPDIDPFPVRICDLRCSPQCQFQQTEANAHLIAAAPELLAALEAAMELGAYRGDRMPIKAVKPIFDAMKAAIAKAKGETT